MTIRPPSVILEKKWDHNTTWRFCIALLLNFGKVWKFHELLRFNILVCHFFASSLLILRSLLSYVNFYQPSSSTPPLKKTRWFSCYVILLPSNNCFNNAINSIVVNKMIRPSAMPGSFSDKWVNSWKSCHQCFTQRLCYQSSWFWRRKTER